MKRDFWIAAERGDVERLNATLASGQPIDAFDERAPLTALHYPVGRDQLNAAKLLASGARDSYRTGSVGCPLPSP